MLRLAEALLRLAKTGARTGVRRSLIHVAQQEDVAMRTAIDFSPLYRSTVRFDRLVDMLDGATRGAEPASASWPPYNIRAVQRSLNAFV
jgi:hypothetical protein